MIARAGHSSPSFCHEPIATTAERVAAAGFGVWEIFGEGGHSPAQHGKDFERVLPSYDFKVQLHAPISDVNLGSLYERAWDLSVDSVREALEGAARIGIERVTIHPGNHTPLSRGHYGKVHEATRRALRRLDEAGNELGLQLCLENMPTGWAFETDSLTQLLDLTQGTEFQLCLDVAHAHVAKRVDEYLADPRRIANVHLSDNRGDYDAHLTLGDGTAPWDAAVRRLAESGYAGTFVVESQTHESGRASLQRLSDVLRVVA